MNYVILAGGTGTRLWPTSRNRRPKQFAHLMSNLTMLEEAIGRLGVDPDFEHTYIATSLPFADLIRELLPKFPENHLIIEPEKRDTGPAIALAAAILAKHAPEEPMAFIPSDHFIRDVLLFRRSLRVADSVIRETGKLLDIGIVPTFANTNLGYTKIGQHWGDRDDIHLYSFAGHAEKPTFDVARGYLKDGHHLWHASYYMWTPAHFLEAYDRYAPEIGQSIKGMAEAALQGDQKALAKRYQQLPKISIDYAVTEKLDPAKALIIKGEFGWSDIGSWDQLYDQLTDETDGQGNLVRGRWQGLDTASCLIFGQSDKLLATIGVSDLVIVDTPDALLIVPRGRAQEIKKLVEKLAETGLDKYL